MKIGVIGGGTVGRATARTYLEFVDEVRVYDILPERSTHTLDKILECDVTFICVPETTLTSLLKQFPSSPRDQYLVLKSTVPVGTTRHLRKNWNLPNLVHSPEFLTARCAGVDSQIPAQLLIGCHTDTTDLTFGGSIRLAQLYQRRFPGVPIRFMTSDESEMTKLVLNAFFATKVAFFNEIQEACCNLDLNYENVRIGVLGDGRVTTNHTLVPGHDGYGFAGACLPKDLVTLIQSLMVNDVPATILTAVQQRNQHDRHRR